MSLLAGGLLVWACSTNSANIGDPGIVPGTTTGATTGTTTGTTTGATTGTTTGTPTGTSTGTGIDTTPDKPDAATTFRRAKVCDPPGSDQNCKCINLASLGAPASKSYGASTGGTTDNTNAFESWLTTKSNASVSFFTSRQILSAEWLANYDVLLLQDLRGWAFSAEEIAAVNDWINGGGGIVALSGYFSDDAAEIAPTNALLANTGLSLLAKEAPAQTCPDSSMELCPNATSACCYCWGNSLPITAWNKDSPFSVNVTAVGGYRGRAVDAGTEGTVVASFEGTTVAASKQVGQGKVLVFGDEWVTYTSQWGEYGQTSGNKDAWNPCWDSASDPAAWRTSGHVFQTMQFWYNAIVNVSPPTECDFVIDEPDEVIIIQ